MSRRKFLAGSSGATGALILYPNLLSSPQPPAGGTPTLPSDTTVGTATARMICWGGQMWTYQDESTLAGWVGDGHKGYEVTWDAVYGEGGAYEFVGSDSSGAGCASQQVMEGASGTVAGANTAGFETYLGFYTQAQPGFGGVPSGIGQLYGDWAPYGNWWSDTVWAGVASAWEVAAQAVQSMGMTGLAFDSEPPVWTPGPHALQQITVTGTSGSFELTYGEVTTGSITYTAATTAATIESALQSAMTSTYGSGVVSVGGPNGGPYGVSFIDGGFIGGIDEMTVASQSGVTVAIADYPQTQINLEARARGNQVAQAIWGAAPDMVLLWYHYYPPGGWNDIIETAEGSSYPHALYAQDYFFEGMLDGMRAVGATGRIVLADASFYRDAGAFVSGSNNQNAYFLNSQGSRAQISKFFDQTVWNYACDHFDITGFTFRGVDGTGFYDNTFPTDAQWAQSVMDARQYCEGPRRVEYQYSGGWSGGPQYPAGYSFSYSTATMLGSGASTGSIPASSTTPISTSVPTLTSLTATLSGGTVTITCNAAHAYGIRYVKVYNGNGFNPSSPASSYLGAMQMTFEANGGSYTTNYNTAYQSCTFSTTGSAGQYFVLEAVSVKDDTHWAIAEAPGSRPTVNPVANVPVATLPEAPAVIELPIAAAAVVGTAILLRRRFRRRGDDPRDTPR